MPAAAPTGFFADLIRRHYEPLGYYWIDEEEGDFLRPGSEEATILEDLELGLHPRMRFDIGLRFFIVASDDGASTIDAGRQLDGMVAQANRVWEPAGLHFYNAGTGGIFRSSRLYDLTFEDFEDVLQDLHWKPGVPWIPVYVVQQINGRSGGVCSYPAHTEARTELPRANNAIAVTGPISVVPGAGRFGGDLIVGREWEGLRSDRILPHELGHFFDLPHSNSAATESVPIPDTSSTEGGDSDGVMTGSIARLRTPPHHLTLLQAARARRALLRGRNRTRLIAHYLDAAIG